MWTFFLKLQQLVLNLYKTFFHPHQCECDAKKLSISQNLPRFCVFWNNSDIKFSYANKKRRDYASAKGTNCWNLFPKYSAFKSGNLCHFIIVPIPFTRYLGSSFHRIFKCKIGNGAGSTLSINYWFVASTNNIHRIEN